VTDETISILDGNTFVVCDGNGDIDASPSSTTGLFSLDTRFLSTWVLTMDDRRLNALSVDDLQYYETRFFLVPEVATHYIDAEVSVIRHRRMDGGIAEDLTVINHSERPYVCDLRFWARADFADLFEIKDEHLDKKGRYYTRTEGGRLVLGYRREQFHRETTITSSQPAEIDEQGLTFRLRLGPSERWVTELKVTTSAVGPGGQDLRLQVQSHGPEKGALQEDLRQWLAQAPKVYCDCAPLTRAYARSLVDLAALRFSPMSLPGQSLPAAGLPWFMTMFGRDSILTSLQALPFLPHLSATTLRILAALQGTRLDDFRDEDPGRIMHEIRYGETASFEDQPHTPYYGSVDATPLFLILLDEYERWTGDTALVHELEYEARAAVRWIDDYADLMGTGYIWYETRNRRNGLPNQCWKDSWDSISYHDGRLPGFPRATCEVQGYAYDAKLRTARLARQVWDDPAFADRLEREAAELKQRFNRDFWVERGGYYAIALDAEGGQVDSLSSNIGHLLWSGIVDDDKAPQIAAHLLGDKLFSGWGVRTLAEGEARYNPIGYHNGTVWPFDNSFIAWGLRRYGFDVEAARIAHAIVDAAQYFEGRLPEAFGGYPRELTKYPVRYPTACSPQAWSSGATLLMIRVMLGMDAHEGHLASDPAIPLGIGRIELLDVRGRWGLVDAFGRGRIETRP
jgi:glycogen debranching enzyme